MQRTSPPFRADHVGSLLRSEPLKAARGQRARGEITAEQFRAIEDREIEHIVRRQQEIGLRLVTDGEYRRKYWSLDFLAGLDGIEMYTTEHGTQFHGVQTQPNALRVIGRIGFPAQHPMLEHFRFLKALTGVTPKMTIPSPTVLHFRSGSHSVPKSIYPDIEQYFVDLAAAYSDTVRAFNAAGCRYLQFDDTVWAYLCSPNEREQARVRGDEPAWLIEHYTRTINQALAARPSDMVITTHTCRGNFRSSWISEGGYEPVAEVVLGQLNYDGYFLEYDTDRAGGFEPLRFLPKGNKQVVLGLVTSKTGTLEREDDIMRRVDEAAKFADLGQLCLSPQCGFASTEEGNILTEEEQWAKLAMIVRIADRVWGTAQRSSVPARHTQYERTLRDARDSSRLAAAPGRVAAVGEHRR